MIVKRQIPIKVRISQFEEEVQIVTVEEELPPDTNAANLWLANRQRFSGRWKLKPDIEPKDNGDEDQPTIKIVGGLPDTE